MKKFSDFLNNFIEQNRFSISIIITITYFQFLINMFYSTNILSAIDKSSSFKNIAVFLSTSLTSYMIMAVVSITFVLTLYIFKTVTKLKSNLIIYIPLFILEVVIILYTYVEIHIFKLLGIHLHNDFIIQEIKNFKMLQKDTNISIGQIVTVILFSFIVLLFSILIYKFILTKDNVIIQKVKLFLTSALFLSVFPTMILYYSYNPIVLSFPFFNLIESKESLIIDIYSKYNSNIDIKLEKKKNIIFIISESHRADVLDKDNTPTIFKFSQKKDVINPKYGYSSAHFTLFSLFSMWYSIYGYNYEVFKIKYDNSAILNLFKRNNYKRVLLTTSDLSYEDSKKMIKQFDLYKKFKFDYELLDYLKKYYSQNLDSNGPYLLYIFLGDSHYGYRSKPEFRKYKPYYEYKSLAADMSGMTNKDKDKLFNRYKNSIYYTDYKFNKILNEILSPKDRDDSIIIFTGDHGEQFWEHGLFGHVGFKTYYKQNILVPLFIQIPGLTDKKDIFLASHLDIWPTILDNVSNITNKKIKSFFQGGYSLLNNYKNDKYFIISSVNGLLGVKGNLTLVDHYGKALIKSKIPKLEKNNRFITIKYLTHDDKTPSNIAKKKLDNDVKRFEEEYKKYFKVNLP